MVMIGMILKLGLCMFFAGILFMIMTPEGYEKAKHLFKTVKTVGALVFLAAFGVLFYVDFVTSTGPGGIGQLEYLSRMLMMVVVIAMFFMFNEMRKDSKKMSKEYWESFKDLASRVSDLQSVVFTDDHKGERFLDENSEEYKRYWAMVHEKIVEAVKKELAEKPTPPPGRVLKEGENPKKVVQAVVRGEGEGPSSE